MMEEHIKLICQLLKKLLAANLFDKLSKCEFQKTRLDYLASSDGIELDPGKVKVILESPVDLKAIAEFAEVYKLLQAVHLLFHQDLPVDPCAIFS